MSEIREAPFTLRFSNYRMMAEFSGVGEYFKLIDFKNKIINYLPENAKLISANIDLIRMQCNYYLPSLYRAQQWSKADPDIDNPADLIAVESEWQRKHTVGGGYAVQISIGEIIKSEGDWHTISYKNLYNTGLEGYVNLLNPLLTLTDKDYFDLDHALGFRVSEMPSQIEFGGRDRISITGACNIYAVYEYVEPSPNILDENAHKEINAQEWTRVLQSRNNRVAFYLSNMGDQPVHCIFTRGYVNNSWLPEYYPVIQPGESLTFENRRFFGGEGKLLKAYELHASQELYCRTKGSKTVVSCQSFYHS